MKSVHDAAFWPDRVAGRNSKSQIENRKGDGEFHRHGLHGFLDRKFGTGEFLTTEGLGRFDKKMGDKKIRAVFIREWTRIDANSGQTRRRLEIPNSRHQAPENSKQQCQ